MFFSIDNLVHSVLLYKYVFLFPMAVIEGPVVSVIAGFLVAGGFLNLWVAYAVLVAADLCGDTMYYLIGFFGGEPFIRRWGRIFGLSLDRLAKFERVFNNHPKKLLLFGKTQAWGSVILATAGIFKMPYPKFIFINFVGTIIKSALFIGIGYYVVKSYMAIDRSLKYLSIFITIITIIIVAGVILWKKYRSKRPSS